MPSEREAGAQHRHSDAFGCQAEAQRLAEPAHGELGSRVGAALVRKCGDAGDRRRVDDVATAAMFANQRHEGLHDVHRATQVDRHRSIPIGETRIGNCPATGDAGVVAQHVNPAEGRDRRVGSAGYGASIGHVDVDEHGVGPGQFGPGAGHVGLVDVADDHVHAFRQQGLAHAEPDAARTARHERGLARKVPHVMVPFSPAQIPIDRCPCQIRPLIVDPTDEDDAGDTADADRDDVCGADELHLAVGRRIAPTPREIGPVRPRSSVTDRQAQ